MSRKPAFVEVEETPGFFRRFGVAIGIGALMVLGGILIYVVTRGGSAPAPRSPEVVTIRPVTAPPPPPPKLPPPPPQQQPEKSVAKPEMMDQSPIAADESKPDNQPPADSGPLGTGIKGDGADGFGLGSGGGNGGTGSGGNGGGHSTSRFGWWAAQVQSKISDALRSHPKTRLASCNIKVRIWPDTTGVIIKARLVDSTGDRDLDEVIKNEVLRGLRLTEPPPEGMPLPIVMRLRAQRTK